jgi:ferredoxin
MSGKELKEAIMSAIDIQIDHTKCTTPFDCKKCLMTCPPAVFVVRTVRMERGKETDKKKPGTYKVGPYYIDRCTGCMDCVNVCPVDAITITIPQEVAR